MRRNRLWKAIVVAAATTTLLAGCTTTTAPGNEQPGSEQPTQVPKKDGPGVTAKELHIADALFSADTESEAGKFYAAMTADYNASGGIGGRMLKFSAGPEIGEAADGAAQAKQTCDAFTERNEHFVYLMDATASGGTASCLSDLGVVTLNTSYPGLVDDDFLTDAPYSFAPEGISRTAVDRATITIMAASGALKGHKVAFVGPIDTKKEVEENLIPLASDHGAEAKGFYFNPDNRESSLLTVTLKLKEGGYDTVVTVTPKQVWTATGPFSLATTFASQGYTPTIGGALADGADPSRYGLGSNDEVFKKALVYGWSRTLYGIPGQQRTDLLNESSVAKQCDQWLDAAGIQLGDAANGYYVTCGNMAFLKDALEASGSDFINADAVAIGAAKIAQGPGADTFTRSFGSGKHDGVSTVRMLAYDADTQTLSYSGDEIEIGNK